MTDLQKIDSIEELIEDLKEKGFDKDKQSFTYEELVKISLNPETPSKYLEDLSDYCQIHYQDYHRHSSESLSKISNRVSPFTHTELHQLLINAISNPNAPKVVLIDLVESLNWTDDGREMKLLISLLSNPVLELDFIACNQYCKGFNRESLLFPPNCLAYSFTLEQIKNLDNPNSIKYEKYWKNTFAWNILEDMQKILQQLDSKQIQLLSLFW